MGTERYLSPHLFGLMSSVRGGVLMTSHAKDFAIMEHVRTVFGNGDLMMCFPTTRQVVFTSGIQVQWFSTTPESMAATAPFTFAPPARTQPGCSDNCIGKSHIRLSFLQRKLTTLCYESIITVHTMRRANRWFCSLPSSVPADGGFCLTLRWYHNWTIGSICIYVEKNKIFRRVW